MNRLQILKPLMSTLLLVGALVGSAQTVQKGYVVEYNGRAKSTPLPGVSLDVRQASSAVSDRKGRFELSFLTLQPGSRISYRTIQKTGYEIFNKDALDQWILSSEHPFKIVMCRSEMIKQLRDTYSKNTSANYRNQYNKELAALDDLRKRGKIKEEEYGKRLREAETLYEKQLDNLQNYVDRFVRIDLTNISSKEREIIALVQAGKMDEAIAKYDKLSIVEQLKTGIEQQHKLEAAVSQLLAKLRTQTQVNDSLYAIAERHISTLIVAGGRNNNQRAKKMYIEVSKADTAKVSWLMKTGDFMRDYLSDYPEALTYYEMAYRAETNGKNDPLTIARLDNEIGLVYKYQNDFGKAMEYFNHCLDLRLKHLPEGHPEYGIIYHNIGAVHLDFGEYAKADSCLNKSLKILIDNHGEIHKDVAFVYSNLGLTAFNTGNYSKAFECFNKSLEIWSATLGDKHPRNGIAYSNIGSVYCQLGDFNKGAENFEKGLQLFRESYGEMHTEVATAYNNMGWVYSVRGQEAEAMESYKKGLMIYRQIHGEIHSDIGYAYNNIATSYLRSGDLQSADEYFTRALDVFTKVYGAEHILVGSVYNNLAGVKEDQGEIELALDYYDKSLAIHKHHLGEDHPNIATLYSNIGQLFCSQKEYDQAHEWANKALAIRLKCFGEKHLEIANSYHTMSSIFFETKDYNKALECSQKALDIRLEILGEDHPLVARTYNNLGNIYEALGQKEKAEECRLHVSHKQS